MISRYIYTSEMQALVLGALQTMKSPNKIVDPCHCNKRSSHWPVIVEGKTKGKVKWFKFRSISWKGSYNMIRWDHGVPFKSLYSTQMIYVLFPPSGKRAATQWSCCSAESWSIIIRMLEKNDLFFYFQVSVHDHWIYKKHGNYSPLFPNIKIVQRQGEAAPNMPRRTRPPYSVHPQFP